MSFRRDGYAVLERFLGASDVSSLRDEVDELLAAPRGLSCERPHNTLVSLRWTDRIVGRVLASGARRRWLREVLEAADLRWISGYLSLKEPRSPALWWHQDWWCWEHSVTYRPAPPQVALLCYLTDTDAHNAALRVLPGSHRASDRLHAVLPEAHATEAEDLSPVHPAMSDHPDQVTLRLGAGDAAVIDYRLLHGTHPNRTGRRRDCVLLSFAPEWRALPAEIRGHLIAHPALPQGPEDPSSVSWAEDLLPNHAGPRRDLALNREAPPAFQIG